MNTRILLPILLLLLLPFTHAAQAQIANVQGAIWADNASNCQFDAFFDRPLSGIVVSATNNATGETRYTNTSLQGFYDFDSLILGTSYTIQPHLPYDAAYYTFSCTSPAVTQVLSSFNQINFPLLPAPQQSLTRLSLSSSPLNPCENALLAISLNNIGTDTVLNTLVDLQLDPQLSYNSFASDIANASALALGNNRYRFSLPQLPPVDSNAQRAYIWVSATLDCNATPQQAIFSRVNIVNADTLAISPNFNDAVLELLADTCIGGDSIEWKVLNRRPITTSQPYIVIEDNIMLRQSNLTVIANDSATLRQYAPAASARSYRVEINQPSGIPAILGDSIVWALSPSCAGNPIGVEATQFYTETTSPNKGFDCAPVRPSRSANFIAASPVGYDSSQYINRGFPVEYQIHFQNTTTANRATASITIDIDTSLYEIPSLHMGAASDPYAWSIRSPNSQPNVARLTLSVDARNTWLPASQDSILSRGFVAFSILPRRSLPAESVVALQANINFGVAPTINTAPILHTIAGTRNSFVQILSIHSPSNTKASLTVFPNPMQAQATVRATLPANAQEALPHLHLLVYNPLGQLVQHLPADANGEFVIQRQNWSAGLYSFELRNSRSGERLAVGKLIVE